jgi:hypothetical protein
MCCRRSGDAEEVEQASRRWSMRTRRCASSFPYRHAVLVETRPLQPYERLAQRRVHPVRRHAQRTVDELPRREGVAELRRAQRAGAKSAGARDGRPDFRQPPRQTLRCSICAAVTPGSSA